jgi:hypothetical protein
MTKGLTIRPTTIDPLGLVKVLVANRGTQIAIVTIIIVTKITERTHSGRIGYRHKSGNHMRQETAVLHLKKLESMSATNTVTSAIIRPTVNRMCNNNMGLMLLPLHINVTTARPRRLISARKCAMGRCNSPLDK